jgi:hypothetical protein
MYKIQPIIDYIVDTYEFEVTPCSVPRSDFQYFKRNFYLFILNKVSEKLFFLLRDKISPIKYLEERTDGSIWLKKRDNNGRIFYEIEIRPVTAEEVIYITDLAGIFKPILDDNNYKIKIYTNISSVEDYTFPFNYKCGQKSIDFHFSKFTDLKSLLRNKKLKSILLI